MAAPPAWFRAERVFKGRNGWHIGSPSGLSIGPYAEKAAAEAASFTVRTRLSRARSRRAAADAVREFVREQSAIIMAADPAAQILQVRAGERSKFWARSSRFFRVDSVWFFHTREGVDVGPYGSESEARRSAKRLIEILRPLDSEPARRVAIYEWMNRPQGS